MNIIWLFFSFKGRIRRIEYWVCSLIISAIFLLPAFILFESYPDLVMSYVIAMGIILVWSSLAIQAKRWHDCDKSAWWLLINLIPYIGSFWAFVVNGFFQGTVGPNRFGEPYSGIKK